MRARQSILAIFILVAACGSAPPTSDLYATGVRPTVVYLYEEGTDAGRWSELEGDFVVEGVPRRMQRPTVHPLRSVVHYRTGTEGEFEVEIARGVEAMPRAVPRRCTQRFFHALLDALTGEVVEGCSEAVGAPDRYTRGDEAVAGCDDDWPPLVVRGDITLCASGLVRNGQVTPIQPVLDIARDTEDGFLAVQRTEEGQRQLVRFHHDGGRELLFGYTPLPNDHDGRSLGFVGDRAALHADGTLYLIGRLDDPVRGEQVVYALGATRAEPVSGVFPADASLRLATGP